MRTLLLILLMIGVVLLEMYLSRKPPAGRDWCCP